MLASLQLCLAPLECSLACLLLAYMIIKLLFFSWWLWRVWNLYLYYFSKLYCFSIFIPIPCISTIFLYSYPSSYRYYFLVFVLIPYISTVIMYSYQSPTSVPFSCISHRSPIFVLFSCIVIYDSNIYCAFYLTCYYLTPDSCMLSPDTCLLSPDSWHT